MDAIMSEQEGVIKFHMSHHTKDAFHDLPELTELMVWRDLCRRLNLLGQDEGRYQGYGYGNISIRHPEKGFLISASQTSGIYSCSEEHFAWVTETVLESNQLTSQGPMPPSSESMTHSSIYHVNDQINCVVHAHSPEIWQNSDALKLDYTESEIPYGTPEMAAAVIKLCQTLPNKTEGVFVMKGHQDGVVSYASTAKQAVELMVRCLMDALENQGSIRNS